jgi:hypothetical protein
MNRAVVIIGIVVANSARRLASCSVLLTSENGTLLRITA